MPAHRIAILYGSASPSGRLLHERLTDAGVAFNGPGSRPVAERALVQGRSRADRPRSAPLASRADESTGIAAADARRLGQRAGCVQENQEPTLVIANLPVSAGRPPPRRIARSLPN